jgi:DNA-binding HxlR family transcriptional regulator
LPARSVFLSCAAQFTESRPRCSLSKLRELETDGIVHRKVYPQVPPRVEYSLTALGASLRPVVNAMCAWGSEHREALAVRRDAARK